MLRRISTELGVNRTVLALSLARLGDAVGNSIIFIVIPLYVADLPSPWFPFPDSVRVGILIALYGLVNALLQPVVGAFSDRTGRRKPFIQAGLVVMVIATLGFIFAAQFVELLILRALQGLGVALTVSASLALMATATEKQTRGGSMGVYSAMRLVGFAAGPLIGGYLQEHFGFNAAFLAGSLMLFAGLIAVQLWIREPHQEESAESVAARKKTPIFDRQLLSVGLIGVGLATFVMAADFSMISALENEFNSRLNQTAVGFGFAFSAMMVGRLVFQIPFGRLADRIGRKPLIIAGLGLMAVVTVLLGYVGSTFQFAGMRAIQGLASAAIAAPAFALGADLSNIGGEGRQMSLIAMGFGLGIAVGPLIAGFLAVVSFTLPFWIGGIMALATIWVVNHYVPETISRKKSSQKAQASPAKGD